ncbi:MAG: hypothetical protein AAB131_11815 [Actinomycetota bacterium]
MQGVSEDSIDLWRQVASAVEYIAAFERPGFSVWDAVADAIDCWIEDGSFGDTDTCGRWGDVDGLRSSIGDLLSRVPPAGAHGGVPAAEALGAALSNWLEQTAADFNDGCRFGERVAG